MVDIIQSLEVGELHRRGVSIIIPATDNVAGATSGWLKNNDNGLATLEQSKTASTMVIPINIGLGYTLVGFKINGQIDSAGNTATLDADLRVVTPVSTGCTNASLGAITQVIKTADYLVNESKTLATPTATETGKSYYLLVTGTTAATTDIEICSVEIILDTI